MQFQIPLSVLFFVDFPPPSPVVGFHGYRLFYYVLFYLQIELAVSSGASLSRLETAPLGSGRSPLPPLLFPLLSSPLSAPLLLSYLLSPSLLLSLLSSFSSPPLLLLPPHFLSFLLFSLPHSAQLSLKQKEAFHLNLNLLACQQSSERSKVSGHHNGSVLLSSSVLRTHYPFCSYMFKEGIWEQS